MLLLRNRRGHLAARRCLLSNLRLALDDRTDDALPISLGIMNPSLISGLKLCHVIELPEIQTRVRHVVLHQARCPR